jgi:hypothetical protein
MSPIRDGVVVVRCRAPAGGEWGEAAFAERACAAVQGVVGQVVGSEDVAVAGLLERGVDALDGTVVAAIGRGWAAVAARTPSEGTRYRAAAHLLGAGAGDVVIVTGGDGEVQIGAPSGRMIA